ncbi:MAG TPA: sigma-70 family RNA polymerase sigma factor [Candidatus Tumulicola sp.]|jgi:RNA polymerase sigma-70 factor (ECF subfamily)
MAATASTVERAISGTRADVETLIREVWPHAFRIASGILRDRALAEDAAQEACAIVYLEIPKLRSSRAFSVWFYRIVAREALALRRRSPAPVEPCEAPVDGRRETDSSVARLDLVSALGRLSTTQRTAVVLHFYAGLNSREIAAVLRMPDSSVRFHLMRARRALERLLHDDGDAARAFSEAAAGAS